MHVCLGAWFGSADAKRFMGWNDERFRQRVQPFVSQWIREGLPLGEPDMHFRTDAIGIPEDIQAHVLTVGRDDRSVK